jgi:hypothetical protein
LRFLLPQPDVSPNPDAPHEERKAIIRILIDAGKAMSPAEIADVLGKKRGAIKVLLGRMAKAAEVIPLGNGTYMAKED